MNVKIVQLKKCMYVGVLYRLGAPLRKCMRQIGLLPKIALFQISVHCILYIIFWVKIIVVQKMYIWVQQAAIYRYIYTRMCNMYCKYKYIKLIFFFVLMQVLKVLFFTIFHVGVTCRFYQSDK